MARIRSVHPSLFTDEAFVTLSPAAQILLIGLWTEADDQGVFEWKPVTIKMRLMPASNADAGPLLAELTASNHVRMEELDGRKYGLVRNFRRFQRPKKPNSVHPMLPEWRTYVGLTEASSELTPAQGGVGGGKPDQMEDGGCRRDDGKKEYRFSGRVIRLKPKDYEQWEKAYASIPDLQAELTRIDAALSAKDEKNWFVAAGNMLNAKHQKNLEAAKSGKPRASPDGYVPMGNSG